jgi:hypothetical protein
MKRKLIIIVLSVALTLTLIPTLAAYADDLDQSKAPDQIVEDVSSDVDEPDANLEEEEGDLDEGEAPDVEMPKINLKSPVTQLSQSDIGKDYNLVARVGAEILAPGDVLWTSDDETIATVSAEGVVTIVGVGKANITAVMKDGSARNGTAKVFVFADKTKKAKKHK